MSKARLSRRLSDRYRRILVGDQRWVDRWIDLGTRARRDPKNYLAWAALHFASQWSGRSGWDVKKLQGVVLRHGDGECLIRFAKVPGANLRRLQSKIEEVGTADELRRFATLPGAASEHLRDLAVVKDVYDM